MNYKHRWEDISYHGSYIWVCKLCNADRDDHNENPKYCPKADQKEKEEEIAKLNKDRRDWEDLKAAKARETYLINKFGEI